MEDFYSEGLSGKARKIRKRRRAARLRAQQMIEEYLEPQEQAPSRHGSIPIRGRREFLPSVAGATTLQTARTASQLELPLGSSKGSRVAEKPARAQPPARGETQAPSDAPIRFPGAPDSKARFSPMAKVPRSDHRRAAFTMKGFLVGCAMGTAAAAVALLVLQSLTG